jgi:hypothetical protein
MGDVEPTGTAAIACGNCGTALQGPYCHACGAREINSKDLSARHFAAKAVGEITDIEHSKLLATLRALLLLPGFLTREYFSARRRRYLQPLPLCLAIFALNFFVYGAGGQVSIFDSERQARVEAYGAKQVGFESERLILTRVTAHAAATGKARAEIYRSIDQRWGANATLIQFPVIVLFALLLALAHLRSKRRLVEHLVFAMHFISFQVLTVVLMWPLYRILGVNFTSSTIAIVLVKYAIDAAYLFFAIRRFYGGPARKTLMRVPLIFGGYYMIYSSAQAAAMLFALESVL